MVLYQPTVHLSKQDNEFIYLAGNVLLHYRFTLSTATLLSGPITTETLFEMTSSTTTLISSWLVGLLSCFDSLWSKFTLKQRVKQREWSTFLLNRKKIENRPPANDPYIVKLLCYSWNLTVYMFRSPGVACWSLKLRKLLQLSLPDLFLISVFVSLIQRIWRQRMAHMPFAAYFSEETQIIAYFSPNWFL